MIYEYIHRGIQLILLLGTYQKQANMQYFPKLCRLPVKIIS